MFSFNFTFLDIVKFIIFYPFVLLGRLVKSSVDSKKDNKLIDDLYDLMEEVECFTNFIKKGPTTLEKYKMKNVLFEHCIDFSFISEVRREQNVISFTINRAKPEFSFKTGGWSAGGVRYFEKRDCDLEELANLIYDNIERSYNTITGRSPMDFAEEARWRLNVKDIILTKYKADLYALRRAFILMSHDKNHPRYDKARTEIVQFFGDGFKSANFVSEIENIYIAKSVMDALEK